MSSLGAGKATKVNWQDTDLAIIGPEIDKKIKEAAASDGQEQWDGLGKEGLRVWRIEKFRVVPWPESQYGSFHTGDSYIVANTYKANASSANKNAATLPTTESNELSHDLHMWIGVESTQDEYGTAAYKMIEADVRLGGAAVQHREVQYKESDMFQDYFESNLSYLVGGVEAGSVQNQPTNTDPHLYQVKGTRKGLALTQKKVRRDEMNSGDVFVLHAGQKVWVWNGQDSNPFERTKGLEVARKFASKGGTMIVLDQGVGDGEEDAADFWEYLPGTVSRLGIFKKTLSVQDANDRDLHVKVFTPVLYELPEEGFGSLKHVCKAKKVSKEKGGQGTAAFVIKRKTLEAGHGYLLDTGFHIYIWLGKLVAGALRVSSLSLANFYMKRYKRPTMAVTVVKQGQEIFGFDKFFYEPKADSCACAII